MDAQMAAMLEFARRWRPFGGCDEQIFPDFGVTAPVFYKRVLAHIQARGTFEVSVSEAESLAKFCTEKLREHGSIVLPPPGTRDYRHI